MTAPAIEVERTTASHRDLVAAVVAAVSASLAALAIASLTWRDEWRPPGAADLAFALGWAGGASLAWAAAAAAATRRTPGSIAAGVTLLSLLAPLAGLGGEYVVALLEGRDVRDATILVVEGARAPDAVVLGLRALLGGLVFGPLLVARALRAGLAWKLAAPMAGALPAAALLALVDLHGVGPLRLELVGLADAVVQLGVLLVVFTLALRGVELAFARRDRKLGTAAPAARVARRHGRLTLAAASSAWALVVGIGGPSAEVAAARLLPWPRDASALAQLGAEIGRDSLSIDELSSLRGLGPAPVHWPRAYDPDTLTLALAIDRRAAQLGQPAAMRRCGEVTLRLLTDGQRPDEAVSREAGLEWLRRASAAGDVDAPWLLDQHLAHEGPEHAEAMRLLLAAARTGAVGPALVAAARMQRGATTREDHARVVDLLRPIALGPPGAPELGGELVPRPSFGLCGTGPPAPADSRRALQHLVTLAPDSELEAWATLAAARGEGDVLRRILLRRIVTDRFQLSDDAWTSAWREPRLLRAVPGTLDLLALWPRTSSGSPRARDAVERARAALKRGRPFEGWALLRKADRYEDPVRQARAIVYLDLVRRRGPVLLAHVEVADLLACSALRWPASIPSERSSSSSAMLLSPARAWTVAVTEWRRRAEAAGEAAHRP